MKDEEIRIYNSVIERYHKIGIDSPTRIVVEMEKENRYYRSDFCQMFKELKELRQKISERQKEKENMLAHIEELERRIDQTGEVFQATLKSSVEYEGDTVIIIKSGQKVASCDVYFQEGENA